MDARGGALVPQRVFEFGKEFHVSPFMPMEQRYRWRFSEPGARLVVQMDNLPEGGNAEEAVSRTSGARDASTRRVFDATLTMTRTELSGANLARVLATYSWMTARVIAGIYWQALRLRLKGVPVHAHPRATRMATAEGGLRDA
jgi:hypothetical protein